MQKLNLNQSLSQKLSPQQIQFIKLLQVPTAELDTRIEEELEINPALEEGKDEEPEQTQEDDFEDSFDDDTGRDDHELNLDDYLDDEYSGYKMQEMATIMLTTMTGKYPFHLKLLCMSS